MIGILIVLMLVPSLIGMWKIFIKAEKPGWFAIIPIYNFYQLYDVADAVRLLWLTVGIRLVGGIFTGVIIETNPSTGSIIHLVMYGLMWLLWGKAMLELAEAFGKDRLFALGLTLLPFIYLPLLGFGEAEYRYAKHR